MKKIFYSLLTLGAVAGLVSCASDDPGIVKGDGNISLTVQLPADVATRFGGATNINKLYYSICSTGEGAKVLDFDAKEWPAGQTSTNVDLELVAGQTYQVVFFACNSNVITQLKEDTDTFSTGYAYNPATGQFYINYSAVDSNNDDYDVFSVVEEEVSTANAGKTIILTRPIAQLNIGTNDFGKGVVTEYLSDEANSYSTTLSIGGLATGVNFLNNDYTTSDAKVDFNLTSIKEAVSGDYPVPDYSYLEMNYLLVNPIADAPTLTNATYTVKAGENVVNELNLTNLPLRANYRTNVYGSLLTQTASFNVVISKGFADSYNNAYATTVETAEELVSALKNGENVLIPTGTTIDTSSLGEIQLANNQKLFVDGNLNTARAQYVISGEGNTAYISGSGTISSVLSNGTGNRPLNAMDGATLYVENVTVETQQKGATASIYSVDGNVILNTVTVNSHYIGVGMIGGTLQATNCTFKSDCNYKDSSAAYTVYISSGCDATLTNCTVEGIQGGVTLLDGAKCTINGGSYSTNYSSNHPGDLSVVYWPVYVTTGSELTVLAGEFSTPQKYTIFNSNEDVSGQEVGTVILKGGKYSAQAYERGKLDKPFDDSTNIIIEPAQGYKWETINDGVFKYEIVPDE